MRHREPSPEEIVRRRATMLDLQLRRRGLTDHRVLAVMGSLAREQFVPPALRDRAYDDSALPIGEEQTISQPYMVARTVELADIHPHHAVLEVGAGSGYQAAVLARLAKQVVTVERIPVLAERARRALASAGVDNVEVVVGDGSLGYPPRAPYDRIVVAAAAPEVPRALLEQLAPGGKLLIPVGPRAIQTLRLIENRDGRFHEVDRDRCVFVPLVGEQGWSRG